MKKTNVPAPVTADKLKSTDGIYGIRLAFKHKANMIAGERFPNPETDSSFAKFRDSEKFNKAVAEMKSGK